MSAQNDIDELRALCDDTARRWRRNSFATGTKPYKGTTAAEHYSRLGGAEAFIKEPDQYRSFSQPWQNLGIGIVGLIITVTAVLVALPLGGRIGLEARRSRSRR